MKKNNLHLLAAVGVLIIVTLACGSSSDDKEKKDFSNLPESEQTVAVAVEDIIKQTVDAYPLLGAEYKKITDMTDIQKEPYLREMIGKEFRVIGDITEVNTDGKIQLQLKNSNFMAISMVNGYPADRLTLLNKSDVIDFIGKVTETDTMIYLSITTQYIRDTE